MTDKTLSEQVDDFDQWLREGGNADVADLLVGLRAQLAQAERERDEARR